MWFFFEFQLNYSNISRWLPKLKRLTNFRKTPRKLYSYQRDFYNCFVDGKKWHRRFHEHFRFYSIKITVTTFLTICADWEHTFFLVLLLVQQTAYLYQNWAVRPIMFCSLNWNSMSGEQQKNIVLIQWCKRKQWKGWFFRFLCSHLFSWVICWRRRG